MPIYTYVEVRSSESAMLADLQSYHHDFWSAGNFARLGRNEREKQNPESMFINEAFWITALIYYTRCFIGGVRFPISGELLGLLSPTQREMHDKLIDIRNKYIAHSVNSFEESIPVAVFDEATVHKTGIHSVHCNHGRVTGLSTPDLNAFIELIEMFHSHLMGRLQEEEDRLLKVVNTMPLEELKKNRLRLMSLHTENPGKPRKKIKLKSRKRS